jgi:hypothetical protein
MPFETVTCPSCGSTDVQQVKPDTYFCNRSETVFKHIDPSRLTVSHAPSFCMHGNPVLCQCQLCGAGMCGACDVLQWRNPDGSRREIFVPAVGFGYLEHPGEEGHLAIIGNRIITSRVTGPFFYTDKLISTLASSHGGLLHVCCPCVASAVPVTADRIITGAVCESPHCSAPSKARCRCCRSAFCEQWLTHDWFFRQGLAENGRFRYYPGVPSRWPCLPLIRMSPGAVPNGIGWTPPDNLCRACVGENVEKAAKLSTKMCEEFPELLPGTEVRITDEYGTARGPDGFLGATVTYEFCVPGERPLPSRGRYSRGQYKELHRISEIAQRCAAEVTERLQKEMAEILVGGGCARQRAFGEKKPYAKYAILDERDKTAPAAAPEVTEARR